MIKMIKTKQVIRTYYRNTSILYRLCSYNISTSSNITSSSNNNINTKVIYSHFKEEIALGRLDYDEHQQKIIKLMDRINHYINTTNNDNNNINTNNNASPTNSNTNTTQSDTETTTAPRLKGLYLYGDVGVGKTLLMDTFYLLCKASKKRVHFHKFMLDIHQQIFQRKQELLAKYGRDVNINLEPERDAIVYVARNVAKDTKVLFFDEFQVTDICDAMILMKFFNEIWNNGSVLIATSNRSHNDLYKDGLNREYFIPFIKRLEQECFIRTIDSSDDYRQKNTNRDNCYFVPLGEESTSRLRQGFSKEMTNHPNIIIEKNKTVAVMMGRTISIPESFSIVNSNNSIMNVAWLEFTSLCESDRGAADYRALCSHYNSIYLNNIPCLSVLHHDKARRFITLIDELYDAHILLHWTADDHADRLFSETTNNTIRTNTNSTNINIAELRRKNTVSNSNSVKNSYSYSNTNTYNNPQSSESIQKKLTLIDAGQEMDFLEGELASIQELGFAFKRCASRLKEMSGQQYYTNWKIKFNIK